MNLKAFALMKTLSLAGFLSLGALVVPNPSQAADMPMAAPISLPTIPPATKTAEPVSSPTPIAAPGAMTASEKTIVEIASTNDSFKTLTAALKAAGLVETLSSPGPFTVFAPTDAAFAALPKGTVEELLKPENKAILVKVLTYHVVSGEVLSTNLKSGNVKTVEGSPVMVKVGTSSVMVNNAKVVKADIKASNGVIHVIDRVILPSARAK
ncbi:fasciclin [Phormidesmis priestleyi ULC007]|uniref:Fasciclin n=1 Tax=Phormidesmis priestleyi ULC007 TaxID=1920490 RepID=A0A2T1DK58_9CYAN|nr:fasciclin domain-containing protein [Phormidesmis priestleyi]PSB20888.1 fasciclin [Phormidesmis priestleyi ULC007]PZO51843.1 MAG: fasciclin domain-containing protein [Phormidesmis priestleyi]